MAKAAEQKKTSSKNKKIYKKPQAKVTNISMGVWGGTSCGSCLTPSTQISMKQGLMSIRKIKIGDLVWTRNANNEDLVVKVKKVSKVPVSSHHHMVSLTLSDGRCVLASPEHPLADKRKIRQIMINDFYDNAVVVKIELLPYKHNYTYDLLPDSQTGHYWADKILLGSTLLPQETYPIAEIFSKVKVV